MNDSNPSFQEFLSRAADHPLLTSAEEVALAKRCEKGDKDARESLIIHNVRLVVAIAKRYRGQGVPFEDLVQEGTIGLDKAVDKFDYRKGFKFSTYATWWVRQRIQRTISSHRSTIRLPVHVSNRAYQYKRIMDKDPDTTIEEAAEKIGCRVDQLEQSLVSPRIVKSLDQPVSNDASTAFGDLLEDETITDPVEQIGDFRELEKAMRTLDDDIRQVLEMRFGFFGQPPLTREEIAARLGIGIHKVRSKQQAGILALREVLGQDPSQ